MNIIIAFLSVPAIYSGSYSLEVPWYLAAGYAWSCVKTAFRKILARPVTDCEGRHLAVGDKITGWYDDIPYAGTVAIIGRRPESATQEVRNITVRRDDGTDHQTFSHAVAVRQQPPDGGVR